MKKTRVVHCKKSEYDVYIGRSMHHLPPSKWGNPFKDGTREENIRDFEEYIRNSPELMASLHELKGKTLGCWCKPLNCHGDVLVELIEEQENNLLKF